MSDFVGVRLNDPREYIAAWLRLNDIGIQPNGLLDDKEHRNKKDIYNTLWLDYRQQITGINKEIKAANAGLDEENKKSSIKGVPDRDMERALDEAIERVSTRKKLEAVNAVKHDPQLAAQSTEQLATWVSCIAADASIVTLAVFQHWLWTVKRKMARLPVVYHIMPVLVSAKQGTGKSTAIKRLVEPLNSFVLDINAGFLGDDRNYFAFGSNFVGFMDEMAGVAKAEVETLKRIITADRVASRKMRSNDVYQVSQLCSFIGTSNKSVGLLISDSAMRRFFEVEAADKLDWQVINSLDYLTILKGIDESRPDGYITPHMSALQQKQEDLVTKEATQLFTEAIQLAPLAPDAKYSKEERTAELYAKYVEWCGENGFYKTNSAWFSKRMRGLGFTFKIKKGVSYCVVSTEYKSSSIANIVELNKPADVVALDDRR